LSVITLVTHPILLDEATHALKSSYYGNMQYDEAAIVLQVSRQAPPQALPTPDELITQAQRAIIASTQDVNAAMPTLKPLHVTDLNKRSVVFGDYVPTRDNPDVKFFAYYQFPSGLTVAAWAETSLNNYGLVLLNLQTVMGSLKDTRAGP
jgi:hypothetical protein